MADHKKPTKEELKQRYGISNDDFEILDTLPPAEEVQKQGSFLVKLSEIAGAQTWMWKTWGGRVIAIALIYMFAAGAYDTFQPLAVWSYEKVPTYLQASKPYAVELAKGYLAFVQQQPAQGDGAAAIPYAKDLPIGTGMFPVSGSMLS